MPVVVFIAEPITKPIMEPIAELVTEPITKLIVKPVAEPITKPAAFLISFLAYSVSSNSYTASSSIAFPFYSFFFYFKLLPLAFLILFSIFPTTNALPPARLPASYIAQPFI